MWRKDKTPDFWYRLQQGFHPDRDYGCGGDSQHSCRHGGAENHEPADEARAVRVQQDIRALGASLNLFRLDNFSYPTTEQGLESLAVKPGGLPSGANWKSGGYIERIPKDPWGAPYRYLQPGSHGEFDLYSLGADGVAGGTDAGKDIGNWNLD